MSLFNVNQTTSSKAQNTTDVPIKESQFLIVVDSGDIYYDCNGNRVHLTDIVVLDNDAQRTSIATPFDKFYFVKETGALWRYDNGAWVNISGSGSISYEKELSVSGWVDGKQNVAIAGLTAVQNGVVGLSQFISVQEREAAAMASLYVSGQAEGYFTVAIGGDKPTCDIPITIVLFG